MWHLFKGGKNSRVKGSEVQACTTCKEHADSLYGISIEPGVCVHVCVCYVCMSVCNGCMYVCMCIKWSLNMHMQ